VYVCTYKTSLGLGLGIEFRPGTNGNLTLYTTMGKVIIHSD
ncbi:unnamed protein product, partial [Didymodactylos carnosus]